MVKHTESNILLIVFFKEQIACDAHTTYFSNTSVPETDCIYSASLHSVYFNYADIILWELIIILTVFSYEYVKMNYLMFCISFYELSFLVYLNFLNQSSLGDFFFIVV